MFITYTNLSCCTDRTYISCIFESYCVFFETKKNTALRVGGFIIGGLGLFQFMALRTWGLLKGGEGANWRLGLHRGNTVLTAILQDRNDDGKQKKFMGMA